MKKLLSVFLAILLVLPCFSLTSFAWGGSGMFEKDGIFYIDYSGDDTVYVAGYDPLSFDEENLEITIPETVKKGLRKTYTVTGLDVDAFVEAPFTKITLPATINYIGDYAFYATADLTEVVIPAECEFEYFGTDVFVGSMAEEKLFGGTDTAIIGKNVLFGYMGNEKDYVIGENIDFIANNCFMSSGIESITFNKNIEEIPYACFANCRNLKSVTIPDTIDTIWDMAFKDCANLAKVDLGKGVDYIGLQAFSNTAIETIHLNKDVWNVSGAFADCKSLDSITVDKNNDSFYADENALYKTWHYELEDFDGSEFVEEGKAIEFYFPSKVNKVVNIPDDVTAINDYAFYYCDNLEQVNAPVVDSVGAKAFSGTDIRVFKADECVYFGESSFRNCKNLEEINLEDAYYIATAAFENCTSLKNVKLSSDIGVIDGAAFANTGIEEIEIYGYDLWLGEAVLKNCKNLRKVTLGDGIYWVSMDTFLGCEKLETVYLSKTIKVIEENAFNECEKVKFEVIKNTKAHRELKKLGYNFEVVGSLTFMEEVTNFFEMMSDWFYELLFGWIDDLITDMVI